MNHLKIDFASNRKSHFSAVAGFVTRAITRLGGAASHQAGADVYCDATLQKYSQLRRVSPAPDGVVYTVCVRIVGNPESTIEHKRGFMCNRFDLTNWLSYGCCDDKSMAIPFRNRCDSYLSPGNRSHNQKRFSTGRYFLR